MAMNGVTSTWGKINSIQNPLIKEHFEKWLNGDIDIKLLRAITYEPSKLRHLSIAINNYCNLKCKHCFLQYESHNDLTIQEWIKVINSSLDSNIHQYVIAGKEPLIHPKINELLLYFSNIKKKYQCVNTGIVTNGTKIKEHITEIKLANFNYIDISLDGTETEHDYIRGNGSFSKSINGIKELVNLNTDNFASITLQSINIKNINKTIEYYSKLGIKNISISPFEPTITNTNLSLSKSQLCSFFNSLSEIKTENDTFVQIDACISELESLLIFIKSKWFDLNKCETDGSGFIYIRHKLNNLTLSFRFLPYPMSLESSVRITSDGYLISVENARHPLDYNKNSLANIRDFDFNFENAFNFALKNGRYLTQDYRFYHDSFCKISDELKSGG
jgi:MoaA/NifB/PqqE/SkfB family radical SAM enzyme